MRGHSKSEQQQNIYPISCWRTVECRQRHRACASGCNTRLSSRACSDLRRCIFWDDNPYRWWIVLSQSQHLTLEAMMIHHRDRPWVSAWSLEIAL